MKEQDPAGAGTSLADLTLDFETYYSTALGFTLRRMPQTLYLRDPRFEVLMVGLAWGGAAPSVVVGEEAVARALAEIPWSEVRCWSHNALFDMSILSGRFGHTPRWIRDTLAEARLAWPRVVRHGLADLGRRLGVGEKGEDLKLLDGIDGARLAGAPDMLRRRAVEYCARDVALCRAIAKALPRAAAHDLSAIDEGVRMTSQPVLRLDVDALAEAQAQSRAHRDANARLRKAEVFAGELRALGIEPPRKQGGAKPSAFAKTDPFMQGLAHHKDARVRALVAARLDATGHTEDARIETLARIGRTGPMPAGIVPCKAHTGRDSGGDDSGSDKINLQNLRRDSAVRRAIRAPEGWTLLVADLAQIEARVLAAIAGETWVVRAFAEGRDVYAEMASQIYGVPVAKETHPRERQLGKIAVLACGYGMGAGKFMATAGQQGVTLSELDATRIVHGYRNGAPAVRRFWGFCDGLLRDMGACPPREAIRLKTAPGIVLGLSRHRLHLPSGRVLDYPGLTNRERRRPERYDWTIRPAAFGGQVEKKVYGGMVAENVVQAVARDLLMLQAYRIRRRTRGTQARLALRVHDELVYACPAPEAPGLRAILEEEMARGCPDWADVPLDVTVVQTTSWGGAKGA